MSKYGDLPISLGLFEVACNEMMFYQDMPIKLSGQTEPKTEPRLEPFSKVIGACCCDFIARNGLDDYVSWNVYVSAKRLFQSPGCSFNRPGYHSDGFMTEDINYVWCDSLPTIFNKSPFALTEHHEMSITEMETQSLKENEVHYADNELLRLDQYNIHKVAEPIKLSIRTFLKVSFSKRQFNLSGNTHNYLLDYNWEMKSRDTKRNDPSK